ncbi:MAG TPA: UbiA family prenyltransferase [Candidatus Limnocylindrales bacterium]|nr:UbiA family prenyltransferase [Candidatus Limnocylindrales bacterium]
MLPRWKDLAELVRAPAALSVPGDTVAGAAAAGTLGRDTPGLIASSVCLYWAGMAANDWADRELDAVERPERPLPSGRVSPEQALTVAVGLTAAGVGLAALTGGRRATAFAVPLAAAVWAYDLRAKNTRGGPAMMATCRGLDVLLGASGGHWTRALPAALTVAAHTYAVTALSRREVGGADPLLPVATLAGTVGVAAAAAGGAGVVGRRPRSRKSPGNFRDLGAGRSGRRGIAGPLAASLAGMYAVRYGAAQARVVADPSAPRVRAAVGAGITGLPLLQGALAARAGACLAGLAVAVAAPLARRLAKVVSPT